MRQAGRVTTRGGAPYIGTSLAAVAAVFVLLVSGCGSGAVATASSHPDLPNGGKLFTTAPPDGRPACSSCHSLQDAGSTGTIGPNLDNAFAGSRAGGYAESSIENVVLDQIRLGSGPVATYTNAEHGVKGLTDQTPMPKNLWTGQDAIDIAAYVASVAGKNGYVTAAGFGTSGADIFKNAGCTGCHTLKAAGSTATVGPNLDQIASALSLAIVEHQVEVGGGVMPAFKGKLSAAQIQAVAQYVVSNAGK